MSSKKSLWYRLGYALERGRTAPERGSRSLAGLKDRVTPSTSESRSTSKSKSESESDDHGLPFDLDDVLTTGAVALAAKALDRWRPRKRAGFTGLLKAGAAGAGAALLVELVRPLLAGEHRLGPIDDDTPDRLLGGAVQGLLYGSVVDPWMPGPPLLKGSVYGSAEYLTHGAGGLTKLLGGQTPLKRIPGVNHLLTDLEPRDRAYLEHLVFGVAMALLYGSSPASSGIRGDAE